jgi:peptidoglycan/xylan/chitin deacetylase (PgdA/CDA1 family)
MKQFAKAIARVGLHRLGGLALVRARNRRKFSVLMFHSFAEADRPGVDAMCAHIARNFEPVSLSTIVAAIKRQKELPDNAVTITVDDGYRDFLLHGHPIFRKHRIPATLYAVAGFSDARLWLWPDQVAFGFTNSPKNSLQVSLNGNAREYSLEKPQDRAFAITEVQAALIEVPNAERLRFLDELGALCSVPMPPQPPADRAGMSWDELRAVAAEGVEVGCHTDTHPILSKLSGPAELDREILGAKQRIEEQLKLPVRHFCYPNGRPIDIGEAVVQHVRKAGFESAVTCSWGMNSISAEPHDIRRTPFDSTMDYRYGMELLAGLHM